MFKSRIIKQSNAELYSMPDIEEDCFDQNGRIIHQSVEEVERQAYEEGFSSGEKAGFQEGERKAELLIERLEHTIRELTDVKDSLMSTLESEVVNLSISIARKIIHDEVRTRPEVIVSVVKEALRKLQSRDTITVKVNPALYDLFMEKSPELLDIHKDIVFDVNKNVPLTGPLVISRTEEVVTDIDSLMSNVIHEMKAGSESIVAEVDSSSLQTEEESEKDIEKIKTDEPVKTEITGEEEKPDKNG